MRYLTSLVFVVLSSVVSPALAERAAMPFTGRWYWDKPETCAADFKGENVAIELKDRHVWFYESDCTARAIRKIGDNSYRFNMTCKGEGAEERRPTAFVLLPKSNINEELLLRYELRSGFALAYRRCQ